VSSASSRQGEMQFFDRSSFARQWLREAESQQDAGRVFSAFFSGYVAFVAASCQMTADHGKFRELQNQKDESLERSAIEFAMKERSLEIDKFITSEVGKRATTSLRIREVPEGEKFKMIGSRRDDDLTRAASFLFDLWSPLAFSTKSQDEIGDQAQYLCLVFRKIRNRLFHGEKAYDPNGTDADLLHHINPILFGVVEVLVVH
jgi:hypothetical protein